MSKAYASPLMAWLREHQEGLGPRLPREATQVLHGGLGPRRRFAVSARQPQCSERNTRSWELYWVTVLKSGNWLWRRKRTTPRPIPSLP